MLSPRLTNCPQCADIQSLIAEIDCRLAELANDLYNNLVYMLNQPFPAQSMMDLLNYKRILTYKLNNPDYACEFSVNMIASKVKILKFR